MNNRPIRLLTSGRAGLGAGALITAVVLLIALGAVWTPVAFADGCPDAEVTFARGTGEPPGIGRVGQAFVDSLRQQTGMEIGVYPVNYAASRLQLHGGDGANDAISHIKSMASSCPNTKLVLGGYSQGATVIDIVAGVPLGSISFGSPLPAAYADNVAAVAVFGNPSNRAGGSLSSLSPLFGSKAIDLCNPTDPICHVGPGNEFSGHIDGYIPTYTTQAASFVVQRLRAGSVPHLPGSVPQLPGSILQMPGTAAPAPESLHGR
ncbi:cutinase family protein [Mycobacterium tuberculosis]|uniref:cutinase family protein n=1 Tax=Mycobacterium tuberculosis TaxID=1773 RepID=UPI00045B6AC7|nr:cutinase family protein [Mycobacterium tuberculosis]KAO35080.1 cutinase Cut3 [Mycobacterium tuberculosis MD19042]KAO38279.1 cutinase Cut3 [Mycobacterium tuberculosis MD17614]